MLEKKAGRKSRKNRLGLTLSQVSLVCAAMVFALVAASCSDDDPAPVAVTPAPTTPPPVAVWSGPAYSATVGTVTVNSSGCLVFPSSITVISFDAGVAGTTARITVSGSVDAANGYL